MLRNTFADNFAQAWKQCFAFDQIIYRYSHKISKVAFNRTLRLYLSESELVGKQPTQLWKVAKKPRGQVVHPSKGNSFCYEGSWSNISSFVSQIDDLWDGWCSVVLCGIVLSRLTHRAKTLIIAGLCIEWGVKGCQNGDGGGLEGGSGSLCYSAGWATEGRWRDTSPMMMQPQCCTLIPEKAGHRHRNGFRIKSVQENEARKIVCFRYISIALSYFR